MRADAKRLRMKSLLLQPAPPPQCDSSPRRLPAVDTESDEPESPRWSPAIGTGSDESGVSRAETQSTETEGFFLFKPGWMVFARELHKSGVGVDFASTRRRGRQQQQSNNFKAQAAARKEFTRLPIGRQQRETALIEQSKKCDPGG